MPRDPALVTAFARPEPQKRLAHDPGTRDSLWRASFFLLTSRWEGYPLSTLESSSHGCPVVSYDIKQEVDELSRPDSAA